jgi:glyoxylase-like metal-dependent hydrolase (beta-lactamase superfamily II)
MNEVAPEVHHLPVVPRCGINVYVLGDVLVDAGIALSAGTIVKALRGRSLSAHAITHAHLDHVGGSARVCEALGVPFWAGADDVQAVQAGSPAVPEGALGRVLRRGGSWRALRVDRALQENDEVAGFRVVATPGHSTGHVSYWRESDRVLVCGDVFFGMNPATFQVGLRQPFGAVTPDPALNRASERKLAALEPELVLFGHGPPLRGAAPKLRAFVDALPPD